VTPVSLVNAVETYTDRPDKLLMATRRGIARREPVDRLQERHERRIRPIRTQILTHVARRIARTEAIRRTRVEGPAPTRPEPVGAALTPLLHNRGDMRLVGSRPSLRADGMHGRQATPKEF